MPSQVGRLLTSNVTMTGYSWHEKVSSSHFNIQLENETLFHVSCVKVKMKVSVFPIINIESTKEWSSMVLLLTIAVRSS